MTETYQPDTAEAAVAAGVDRGNGSPSRAKSFYEADLDDELKYVEKLREFVDRDLIDVPHLGLKLRPKTAFTTCIAELARFPLRRHLDSMVAAYADPMAVLQIGEEWEKIRSTGRARPPGAPNPTNQERRLAQRSRPTHDAESSRFYMEHRALIDVYEHRKELSFLWSMVRLLWVHSIPLEQLEAAAWNPARLMAEMKIFMSRFTRDQLLDPRTQAAVGELLDGEAKARDWEIDDRANGTGPPRPNGTTPPGSRGTSSRSPARRGGRKSTSSKPSRSAAGSRFKPPSTRPTASRSAAKEKI